jgi:spermidine synthase
MTRPWKNLETVDTAEGPLVLSRRGEREFLITIDGRVLMNGVANRSELALAELACEHPALVARPTPRVLVGGLGLGFTLRAALDALPAGAQITVAELNEVVVRWCQGVVGAATDRALEDPRVTVQIADVARVIATAAQQRKVYDAIILDLYEGPHEATQRYSDPFYGAKALGNTRAALSKGGIFAVWSEEPDKAFEGRLAKAGFQTDRRRAGKGGRRHVIYLAKN